MSREVHVRFCERREVKLLPATHHIVGFQYRDDAERFLAELRTRLAQFNLELAAEKTRLIEFGRFAAERRQKRGLGKPETFAFLGFAHMCAKDRHGRFALRRVTEKKRMRAKLKAIKEEQKRRRHLPIPEQGRWLGCASVQRTRGRVVQGTTATTPCPATSRRSARSTTKSSGTGSRRFGAAASAPAWTGNEEAAWRLDGCLQPGSCIPGPTRDSTPEPERGAQCGSSARWDLRGGRPAMAVPTGAPGMTSSSGVRVPRGGDDTNHKPMATASS
jgi:hypothetical protein